MARKAIHRETVMIIATTILMLILLKLEFLGRDTITEPTKSGFEAALLAHGPAPEYGEKLGLYGRFIGDWDADIVVHGADGKQFRAQGEIHFGWVLEGRAIQDVWMIPRRDQRRTTLTSLPIAGNWYGTTLRVYDAKQDAWRIFWIDPATNTYRQQIGRKVGDAIVQEGTTETGARTRWIFNNITDRSFDWRAEVLSDKGDAWRLVVEVFARRATP